MSIRPDLTLFEQIIAHAGHKLIGVVKGVRGEEYQASIECLTCDEVLLDTYPLVQPIECFEPETRTFCRQSGATISWDDTDWGDSLRTMANNFKAMRPDSMRPDSMTPCCERDYDGDGNCGRHPPTNDSWVQGYMRWRRRQPGQA